MLLDGIVGATRRRDAAFDAGEYFDDGDAVAGQAGFGMDDYGEPHRCRRQSAGSGCGHFPEVCGSCRDRLPRVESAEGEDHDDGETGVGGGMADASGFRITRSGQKLLTAESAENLRGGRGKAPWHEVS